MDGGGRLDQPLKRSGQLAKKWFGAPADEPDCARAQTNHDPSFSLFVGSRRARRLIARLARIPQGAGVAGSLLLIGATLFYGAIAGGHVGTVTEWLKGARDNAANALGFRIAAVSVSGGSQVSREQALALAGVTGRSSLLFFNAETARAQLLANPWIADAAVLKFYPDRLLITITERRAFALWQRNGQVNVIADDGTVLQPFVEDRYRALPLVVGSGAERRAKDVISLLDRFPEIRSALSASVLVAERRWNLRLTNGMDVRLPENDLPAALDRLVKLDRDKKLLSRDITSIDLRLPDRVTVRLSDAAMQAREEALKANAKKKKGGDA
ncbi:MAG: cell division protein FtsQ/DivIB [Rhizobiales bacterium]|nr:cell division protein FtsQ/DivIB [Hyphomicrobiales bacterium]